jgi:hypothetical protein
MTKSRTPSSVVGASSSSVLRLFNELVKCDKNNVVKEVRETVERKDEYSGFILYKGQAQITRCESGKITRSVPAPPGIRLILALACLPARG